MNEGERFDDAGLAPEVRKNLRDLAAIIIEGERRQTQAGVVIGNALLEAKRCLRHGIFLRWCRLELNFKARTAQRYMNAASLFNTYGDVVCSLQLTAAQDLGASSVDPDTVREVLARLRRGETVTVEWVKEAIRRRGSAASEQEPISDHSEQIAEIITQALDLGRCLRVQALLEEQPSPRLLMMAIADGVATKIRRSRAASATNVMLSLLAA